VILVDTSVLVGFLAGHRTPGTRYLDRLVREQAAFYLTPMVVQEVLQGARDEAQWRTLREYLESQLMIDAREPLRSHVEAARIYFECRRRGLTVRSTLDCLIAQIAMEHEMALLQEDRDFDSIRKVRPLATLP
jgi:predicted nucleic acid-binding protein